MLRASLLFAMAACCNKDDDVDCTKIPAGCSKYFDGCNNCQDIVFYGWTCNQQQCSHYQAPKCVEYDASLLNLENYHFGTMTNQAGTRINAQGASPAQAAHLFSGFVHGDTAASLQNLENFDFGTLTNQPGTKIDASGASPAQAAHLFSAFVHGDTAASQLMQMPTAVHFTPLQAAAGVFDVSGAVLGGRTSNFLQNMEMYLA